MRWLRLAGVSLLVVALGTGCGAGRSPGTDHPSGTDSHRAPAHGASSPERRVLAVQTAPVPIAQQMAGQTGIVRLAITDRGFEPRVVKAEVGGRVKLHVVNQAGGPHNLVIPRFAGIATRDLAPGDETYVEFTANQKGEWPFFSDVSGGAEPDLSGTLQVE